MRVLVTGCGGFLGSEVVRQLLARGDQVVGISRRRYPELEAAGMSHHAGDITDVAFVNDVVRDVEAVVHTAAMAGVWGPWAAFHHTNTMATQFIVNACQKTGIGTLVFTSSPSVTFTGEDQCGVDESVPYPQSWLCAYSQTKAAAEQVVLQSHAPGRLHVCALRPHLIWGDHDPHLIPRVVQRSRDKRLRIVGDGQNLIDTVHVINAAASHLDALDALRERPAVAGGRAYFISDGEPVHCWSWLAKICELAGVSPPTKRISYQTAYRLGAVLEAAYRISGWKGEPPMTRFVAAQLARHHYFDIAAARERLGYRLRISTEEGVERLAAALRRKPV